MILDPTRFGVGSACRASMGLAPQDLSGAGLGSLEEPTGDQIENVSRTLELGFSEDVSRGLPLEELYSHNINIESWLCDPPGRGMWTCVCV